MVILTSFPPPSEGIRHQQPNTSAHVENKDLGIGTLYIAESRVSWVSVEGQGFSLEYPAISLHAISRDPTVFPKECLYLMVNAKLEDASESEDEEEEEGDYNSTPVTEIRFVPQDTTILDAMYRTMSECQTLHPDPNDSISEGGAQQATNNHNDEEPMDASQFEDAEPEH
uniref:Methylosome subunit pICln n=1 Tax=Strigamia maritima TaxID=126957 RepID=T1IW02_STRMM